MVVMTISITLLAQMLKCRTMPNTLLQNGNMGEYVCVNMTKLLPIIMTEVK